MIAAAPTIARGSRILSAAKAGVNGVPVRGGAAEDRDAKAGKRREPRATSCGIGAGRGEKPMRYLASASKTDRMRRLAGHGDQLLDGRLRELAVYDLVAVRVRGATSWGNRHSTGAPWRQLVNVVRDGSHRGCGTPTRGRC